MRWKPSLRHPSKLLARSGGSTMGAVDFDPASDRFVGTVKLPLGPTIFGMFTSRERAKRFVERELWAECGELAAGERALSAQDAGDLFWLMRGSGRRAR